MGKKGSTMPADPDMMQSAQMQMAENQRVAKENIKHNQIKHKTPYGQVYYSGEVGSTDRTRHVELDPELDQYYKNQMHMARQMSQKAQQMLPHLPQGPMNYSDLPELPTNMNEHSQKLQENYFNQAMDLLKPKMQEQRKSLETDLAHRGIPKGSEAYHRSMQDMHQYQNGLMSQAAMNATQMSHQNQSREFDMSKQARQQMLNEKQMQRTMPFTEFGMYQSHQMPSMVNPQFDEVGGMTQSPVNYMPYDMYNLRSNLVAESERQKRRTQGLAGLIGLGKAIIA